MMKSWGMIAQYSQRPEWTPHRTTSDLTKMAGIEPRMDTDVNEIMRILNQLRHRFEGIEATAKGARSGNRRRSLIDECRPPSLGFGGQVVDPTSLEELRRTSV
jgi:hypothetical protein